MFYKIECNLEQGAGWPSPNTKHTVISLHCNANFQPFQRLQKIKMHCVLQVAMSRVQVNATVLSKVFNIEEKHSLIGNSLVIPGSLYPCYTTAQFKIILIVKQRNLWIKIKQLKLQMFHYVILMKILQTCWQIKYI